MPEDLQSILTDSTLHNGSAELTTKEILSRYGDIAKGNVQLTHRTAQAPDAPAQGQLSASSSSRSNPVAMRVESDPSQATAWQKQSSVRPVQNTSANPTAPQHDFDFNAPQSPYARDRSGSQGSQGSQANPNGRQSYQHRPGLGVAS